MRAPHNVRDPSGAIQLCAWRCRHALSIEADLLPSLDAERLLAEAHREPLREQLWRSAAAPECHTQAVRSAHFRKDAGLGHHRPEAQGAGRAHFTLLHELYFASMGGD